MEVTKKVVSQIETILCQKMAEATGKPAHEFSLSVEKREELKVAIRDYIDRQYGNVQEQLKQKDAIIENLSDLIDIKNEKIENLKHQIALTH